MFHFNVMQLTYSKRPIQMMFYKEDLGQKDGKQPMKVKDGPTYGRKYLQAAHSLLQDVATKARPVVEMSNEEQKLLDLQIELFAYWEVIKKRLVDYLQLAARAELAVLPIQDHLKPKMIERVLASPSCM